MNSHRLTRFRWEFIRWGGTACCAGRVQPTALSERFFTQCNAQRRLGPHSRTRRAAADAGRWAASTRIASAFWTQLGLLQEHRFCANQPSIPLREHASRTYQQSTWLRVLVSCAVSAVDMTSRTHVLCIEAVNIAARTRVLCLSAADIASSTRVLCRISSRYRFEYTRPVPYQQSYADTRP
jgi:hypothetical protein